MCAEEASAQEFLLCLESSDMANLAADAANIGFASGPGITPGRLLRVGQALTRAAIMTLGGTSRPEGFRVWGFLGSQGQALAYPSCLPPTVRSPLPRAPQLSRQPLPDAAWYTQLCPCSHGAR